MIINFQNTLPGSPNMTIFDERSLQTRKIIYKYAHNFLFTHLISTKVTFLKISYQGLLNDI